MSEITQEQVVAALGNMTVMEIIQLTKDLEKLWGVEAKPGVVEAVFIPTHEVVKEAQTEFEVVLLSFPADKKIALVKVIREVLGLGLLESKNVIESALPKTIKDGMSQVDAEALKVRLMETGASVEIK
jgi:large subunit ribosomal protein L7/L12